MRLASFTSLLATCVTFCGCVTALRPSNQPSQEKLHLESRNPQQYTIRVADQFDYAVPEDGRVIVNVPPLDRGCATYLLGVKVKDTSPRDVPAIHIKRDTYTVKRLSLNDLATLEVDADGYRLVKLK
jgi:hypothetical protein